MSPSSENIQHHKRQFGADHSDYCVQHGDLERVDYPGYTCATKRARGCDAAIKEEVIAMLDRHSAIDATEIEVVVEESCVLLQGVVADEAMKRLAEELCDRIYTVKEVTNLLRIRREDEITEGSTSVIPTHPTI